MHEHEDDDRFGRLCEHCENDGEREDGNGAAAADFSFFGVFAESDDESEKVKCEWKHPKERHAGDIGGDVIRDAKHEAGWHERETDPLENGFSRDSLRGARRERRSLRSHSTRPRQQRAAEDAAGEYPEGQRPESNLLVKSQVRFEDERIGEERAEAAEIAGGVEEVRVFRGGMPGVGEPALEQRSGRGENKNREADGFGEDQQEPKGRIVLLKSAVLSGADHERKCERGADQNNQMEQGLEAAEPVDTKVSISVAGQEHRLEENHDCVPHGGCTAEQWQEELANERLHGKQQDST